MKRISAWFLCLVLLLGCSGIVSAYAEPSSGPAIKKPVYVTVYDDTGAPASGVSFDVLGSDGSVVESLTSTGSSTSVFLPAGTYTLKITSVPEGYLFDEDEVTITVTLEEAELRDDLVGEAHYDHSHDRICTNPAHVGIETYTVHDQEGSVTAYCFNQNYDNPNASSRYRRLVGTPDLLYSLAQNKNGSVGPQALYDHVLSIIYRSAEIQARYGLDNITARYITNMAIKSFTDPTCFISFDDDGNSMLERDENGRPIRDENGNYVFKPGGTVLGSLVNHSRGEFKDDVFPQELRDAYHDLISSTSHPSDYYLYIYYPDNFQPGNTDTFQCLMSAFQVEPVRTSLYVRTATGIEITKVWEDGEDQDGIRPDVRQFTRSLHLLADDADVTETYADKLTVTANDNGTFTAAYTGLPKLNDSKEPITYRIREDAIPGYTADNATVESGATITNTHTPELTDIEISKTWDDGNDADGLRPEEITVKLFADSEELQTVTVKPDSKGNWSYTFKELPKYAKGREIVYTVTEEPVDGYETTVDGFHITNTHQPETTQIDISKTWDDGNDQDGLRPPKISVNLLADGTVVQTVVITPAADGSWSHSFQDLPKNAGGKEIVYTVTEESVAGYEVKVDGFHITNTHKPETVKIVITKAWSGSKTAKRPDSITVHLLANGETIQTVTIKPDSKGNWSYTFEDLPKYAKGRQITYTVTEDKVSGYYTSITPNANGFLIRNSTTPITGDDARPFLWGALICASLAGLSALAYVWRRKDKAA